MSKEISKKTFSSKRARVQRRVFVDCMFEVYWIRRIDARFKMRSEATAAGDTQREQDAGYCLDAVHEIPTGGSVDWIEKPYLATVPRD